MPEDTVKVTLEVWVRKEVLGETHRRLTDCALALDTEQARMSVSEEADERQLWPGAVVVGM
jgi:hypothetical protein